MANKQDTSSL